MTEPEEPEANAVGCGVLFLIVGLLLVAWLIAGGIGVARAADPGFGAVKYIGLSVAVGPFALILVAGVRPAGQGVAGSGVAFAATGPAFGSSPSFGSAGAASFGGLCWPYSSKSRYSRAQPAAIATNVTNVISVYTGSVRRGGAGFDVGFLVGFLAIAEPSCGGGGCAGYGAADTAPTRPTRSPVFGSSSERRVSRRRRTSAGRNVPTDCCG